MRSLLLIPPGDRQAFAAGLTSGADAVLADAAAASAVPPGVALYLRLPPLDAPDALRALSAAVALRPAGVALATAGGADAQRLGSRLAVEEALAALPEGAIRVLALATETPQAVLGLSSYPSASARLAGLLWSVSPLDGALKLAPGRRAAGPLRLARDLALIAARAAGVLAIDAPYPGDLDGLRAEAARARDDGFDGKAAISAAQVAVINAVFAGR